MFRTFTQSVMCNVRLFDILGVSYPVAGQSRRANKFLASIPLSLCP